MSPPNDRREPASTRGTFRRPYRIANWFPFLFSSPTLQCIQRRDFGGNTKKCITSSASLCCLWVCDALRTPHRRADFGRHQLPTYISQRPTGQDTLPPLGETIDPFPCRSPSDDACIRCHRVVCRTTTAVHHYPPGIVANAVCRRSQHDAVHRHQH